MTRGSGLSDSVSGPVPSSLDCRRDGSRSYISTAARKQFDRARLEHQHEDDVFRGRPQTMISIGSDLVKSRPGSLVEFRLAARIHRSRLATDPTSRSQRSDRYPARTSLWRRNSRCGSDVSEFRSLTTPLHGPRTMITSARHPNASRPRRSHPVLGRHSARSDVMAACAACARSMWFPTALPKVIPMGRRSTVRGLRRVDPGG